MKKDEGLGKISIAITFANREFKKHEDMRLFIDTSHDDPLKLLDHICLMYDEATFFIPEAEHIDGQYKEQMKLMLADVNKEIATIFQVIISGEELGTNKIFIIGDQLLNEPIVENIDFSYNSTLHFKSDYPNFYIDVKRKCHNNTLISLIPMLKHASIFALFEYFLELVLESTEINNLDLFKIPYVLSNLFGDYQRANLFNQDLNLTKNGVGYVANQIITYIKAIPENELQKKYEAITNELGLS